MTGFALRTFISLFEGPAGSWIYPVIAWQSGISQVWHEGVTTCSQELGDWLGTWGCRMPHGAHVHIVFAFTHPVYKR